MPGIAFLFQLAEVPGYLEGRRSLSLHQRINALKMCE